MGLIEKIEQEKKNFDRPTINEIEICTDNPIYVDLYLSNGKIKRVLKESLKYCIIPA